MYVLVFFIIKKSWVVLPSPPQKFYYLHIQGGYRGVGRNVAPPPLSFQKSSSIALKGKKTASAKQESQSKISSSVRLLVPKSGLLSSEINLAPPSLKSFIRPWLVIMSTKWKYFDYLFRCRGINPLSPPCNPISVNVGIAEFSLVAGNLF